MTSTIRCRVRFTPGGRFSFIPRAVAAELLRLHKPITLCAPIRGARLLKGASGLVLIVEVV